MKKRISLLLTMALIGSVLAGCTTDSPGETTVTTPQQVTTASAEDETTEPGTETTADASDETTTELETEETSEQTSETPAETSEETTDMTTEEATEETTEEATETETQETNEPHNPYLRNIPQPTIWTESLDDDNYNLSTIDNVRMVELITGDGSPNMTRERFRVGGTDLGIPVVHNDLLYLWFGDTFYGDEEGNPMAGGAWRNNVLAISEDTEFHDGLRINDFVGFNSGDTRFASELISGRKTPGVETTVIPTGSVSANGKMYTWFMSVREWGPPGQWDINYGGLAVSDDAETFRKVDGFELDPDRFGQLATMVIGDYVYGVGIGGGRFGDAYLLRVPLDGIEDISRYEYLHTIPEAGASDEGMYGDDPQAAVPIFDGPVGEPSITYNAYLEEYMVTYLDEHMASIVMRVAKDPWGPWSDKLVIASGRDYPALYGGFVHEALMADDGQTFYFILSQWEPIYNSILFEVDITRD